MKKIRIVTVVAAITGIVLLSAFTLKNTTTTNAKSVMTENVVAPIAQKWELDRSHSNIGFSVEHMLVSETTGKFRKFEGSLIADKADFTDAQVEFTADVNSIDTEDEKRDGHLKSDDFFNAEKFPQIKFKSKSFKKIDGTKYILNGDLTIRDVTKNVDWAVITSGIQKDPWGNTKAGFRATIILNRFDYNLKWNTLTEAGGAVVGKDVTIKVNVEFKKS